VPGGWGAARSAQRAAVPGEDFGFVPATVAALSTLFLLFASSLLQALLLLALQLVNWQHV